MIVDHRQGLQGTVVEPVTELDPLLAACVRFLLPSKSGLGPAALDVGASDRRYEIPEDEGVDQEHDAPDSSDSRSATLEVEDRLLHHQDQRRGERPRQAPAVCGDGDGRDGVAPVEQITGTRRIRSRGDEHAHYEVRHHEPRGTEQRPVPGGPPGHPGPDGRQDHGRDRDRAVRILVGGEGCDHQQEHPHPTEQSDDEHEATEVGLGPVRERVRLRFGVVRLSSAKVGGHRIPLPVVLIERTRAVSGAPRLLPWSPIATSRWPGNLSASHGPIAQPG